MEAESALRVALDERGYPDTRIASRVEIEQQRVDIGKDIGPSIQNDSQMKRDDLREVVNLQKLFNVAVYLPGGEALVRRLAGCFAGPPDRGT